MKTDDGHLSAGIACCTKLINIHLILALQLNDDFLCTNTVFVSVCVVGMHASSI